jgi:hypothetical protein
MKPQFDKSRNIHRFALADQYDNNGDFDEQ